MWNNDHDSTQRNKYDYDFELINHILQRKCKDKQLSCKFQAVVA